MSRRLTSALPMMVGHHPQTVGCKSRSRFLATAWFNQLIGLTDPGAGLPNVEMPISEIENIFDTIFAPSSEKEMLTSDNGSLPTEVVQVYGSDEDM